jgi:glycosyltransferase involved in cell wall biosynthesis
MKLSIVIPVYNEAQTVREVIERVLAVNVGDFDREIIVVDDGSTDASAEIADEAARAFPTIVRAHHSPINLGKGAALRIGFRFSTGDFIVVQDADLELDPEEYVRLLAPILDGRAEIVYGSRFAGDARHVRRVTRIANQFLTTLTNLLFFGRLTDMETAYKAFRRDVLQRIRLRCVGFDFEPEFTAKVLLAGYRVVEVPITYRPRRENEGKKIGWTDGLDAVYTLLRCRCIGRRDIKDRVARVPPVPPAP